MNDRQTRLRRFYAQFDTDSVYEEFQKPPEKIRVERITRHIYDLEKLMDTVFAEEALNNSDLYNIIVEHRRTLTAMKEVDYTTHVPEKINFVPPAFMLDAWQKDYEIMTGFNDIIIKIIFQYRRQSIVNLLPN